MFYSEEYRADPVDFRTVSKRKFDDLKIYYNFFTDSQSNFELKSTIYSDLETFISLEKKYKDYITESELDPNLLKPEEMFEKEEMSLESLFRKRKKIYILLSSAFREPFLTNSNKNKEIDCQSHDYNFCKNDTSKCEKCIQICSFNLDQIQTLTYKMVNNELKLHHHPTSRLIGKKQRNVKQIRSELLEHYKTRHSF